MEAQNLFNTNKTLASNDTLRRKQMKNGFNKAGRVVNLWQHQKQR